MQLQQQVQLQQEQLVQLQQQEQLQQEQLVQLQQQVQLQEQEQLLLFCHKQSKQGPTKRPIERNVSFSFP